MLPNTLSLVPVFTLKLIFLPLSLSFILLHSAINFASSSRLLSSCLLSTLTLVEVYGTALPDDTKNLA